MDTSDSRQLDPRAVAEHSPQVIALRLLHPEEMFVLGQTDLFSEHRNFLTGVERAISTLRGHRSGRPVHRVHAPRRPR